MKKRLLSILLTVCLVLGLCSGLSGALQVQAADESSIKINDLVQVQVGESLTDLKVYRNGVYEAMVPVAAGADTATVFINGKETNMTTEITAGEAGEVCLRMKDNVLTQVTIQSCALVGNFFGLGFVDEDTEPYTIAAWEPNDPNAELNYLGGGLYGRTFQFQCLKEDLTIADTGYKVAFNDGWDYSIGDGGSNIALTIPAGSSSLTILVDEINRVVYDSVRSSSFLVAQGSTITKPALATTVSLVGTVRCNEAENWTVTAEGYEFDLISDTLYRYEKTLEADTYSYKCVFDYESGYAAECSFALAEKTHVVFLYDTVTGRLYDTVNDYSAAAKLIGMQASSAQMKVSAKYLDKNGTEQTCNSATVVTENDTEWTGTTTDPGWYVVNSDVTIGTADTPRQVTVSGDVHLILVDGCTLTVNGGVQVQDDDNDPDNGSPNALTIYAQSTGTNMGKLMVNGEGISVSETLTINGGKITVNTANTTGNSVCGIYLDGDMTVNGGAVVVNAPADTITVTGTSVLASGIFCTGTLTVNGGSVNATAASVEVSEDSSAPGYMTLDSYGIFAKALELTDGSITATGGSAKTTGDLFPYASSCGIALGSSIEKTSGSISGGSLTAIAGKAEAGGNYGSRAYSYAIASNSSSFDLSVSGEDSLVTATANEATATGDPCLADSCALYLSNNMTVSGGTVELTAGPASVVSSDSESKSDSRAARIGTLTVTGGSFTGDMLLDLATMSISGGEFTGDVSLHTNTLLASGGALKLTESNFTYGVEVSGSLKLADLLAEGYAYMEFGRDDASNKTEVGFVELGDQTRLSSVNTTSYGIKLCTHSGDSGTCAYCGKDLGSAPTPSTPDSSSSGGSSSSPSYTVTAPETDNGSVTVSPKRAEAGSTVTITVTPDSGYTLETLTVLDKNGNEIELTAKGDGKYTFKMPSGKVEIRATFMEDNTILNFFVDVTADKYYYDAVLWAAKNGITGGIDENHFGPDLSCTRAQLVTFLWRAAGSPAVNYAMDFSDVDANAYYGEAIRWANSLGIVGGYGNGLFGTDDTITREQMAVILYRFAQAMGMDTTQGGMAVREFADYESISGYATEAMQWAVNAGILQGSDGKLMPGQPCTRAQIVTMMWRLLGE